MSKTSTSLFASVTKIQVYCLISQIAIFAVITGTLTSLAAAAPRFPFIDDVTELLGQRSFEPGAVSAMATFSPRTANLAALGPTAVYIVDNTGNLDLRACTGAPNDCTLRGAIEAANLSGVSDTIEFDPVVFSTPQTITLSGSGLWVNNTGGLTINGRGKVTVSGNNLSRVFLPSNEVTLTLNGLTITGGIHEGAGINNVGSTLNLIDCTVSGNSALSSSDWGGGISTTGDGTTNVINSTISGNSADGGAGIFVGNGSTVNIINSTVSGNTSTFAGGGILAWGGTINLVNSTVSGNSTTTEGGGINRSTVTSSTVNSRNSIITGNTATGAGPDFWGDLVSQGHNLIGNTSSTNILGVTTGNILNQNPQLGPLQDNGGPTFTHLIPSNSAARNAGSNALAVNTLNQALVTDQRGRPRIAGTSVDMGSVESNPAPFVSDIPNVSINEDTATANMDFSAFAADGAVGSLTVSASSNNPGLVPNTGANLTLSGAGINRAVRVTPSPNMAGTATITVTASDGVLSGQDTFVLTVNPLPDTIVVDNISDNVALSACTGAPNDCSLRGAMIPASNDTIEFDPVVFSTLQTITLGGTPLTVANSAFHSGNLSINGSGKVRVSAGGLSRVMEISGGATVALNGLTITGGSIADGDGGGINLSGTLTLTNVVVTGNILTNPSKSGGGLYCSSSNLTIINSTFSSNTAARGGGLSLDNGTTLIIDNSTFSGNVATGDSGTFSGGGGAIFRFRGTATVTNSTFSSNTANNSLGGAIRTSGGDGNTPLNLVNSTFTANSANSAGGIANEQAVMTNLSNTIIAGNTATTNVDVGGNFTVGTTQFSLIGNRGTATGLNGVSNLIGTSGSPINAQLGLLIDNGGPTMTHSLLSNSPARNAGSNALAVTPNNQPLTTDQRGEGFPRTRGGTVDIGAFEASIAPTISDIANTTTNEDTATGNIGFTVVAELPNGAANLTISATSDNQTLIPNGNITFGGSGTNRTLTINPAPNQSGSALITVVVADPNSLTATDTFTLTVNPVNDAPIITDIPNQAISQDASTGVIPFGVGDLETPAANLTVTGSSSNTTFVPNANIVFGGSGANRTVTVTPAINQIGMTTITVTVTDANGATGSDTFALRTNRLSVVDNTTDNGGLSACTASGNDCSLRGAIIRANNSGGDDTIEFDPDVFSSVQTITLGGSRLEINNNGSLTINGNRKVRVSGNNVSQVLLINIGATATLNGLTVMNGKAFEGGGLQNYGTLNLLNSTVSGNSGSSGGGIQNSGSLKVFNSTISHNTATGGPGAGIYNDSSPATVNLTNSTVVGNTVEGGAEGGGVFNTQGNNAAVTVSNTIIFGNQAGFGPDVRGVINSKGHNLIGNTASMAILGNPSDVQTDILDQNAQLGDLLDNGGGIFTHALLPNSPARNAGSNALALDPDNQPLSTDQRGPGFQRIFGGTVDIGAFEFIQNLTVTKTADTNDGSCDADCSLREAIAAAAAGDNVVFSPFFNAARTITLTSPLVITRNLTIKGPGADLLTVSGNNQFLVFDFIAAGAVDVLSDLTISGGKGLVAGGINNSANLTLRSCNITSNNGGPAGGIQNFAVLTVIDSTISNNTATVTSGEGFHSGGGIADSNTNPTLTIINSTISGNTANGEGNNNGGILHFEGTLVITNSTITNNRSVGGGSNAGGLMVIYGTATLSNTIVAGNQNNASVPDVGGVFTSRGHNLIGNRGTASGFTQVGDQTGTAIATLQPLLLGLTMNGGHVPTHAPQAGSPARDAGSNTLAVDANNQPLQNDQRGVGFARIVGNIVDIGAFEFSKMAQTITVVTHAPVSAPLNSTFTVAATSTSGLPVLYGGLGACTNVGAVFTMTASTGTCTVRYDQAGDNTYDAALQVTESVTAEKGNQTITVGTHAPAAAPGNSGFTVAATSTSGLLVSYTSSGACTNSGAVFSMTAGTGICIVTYIQAGNSDYNAAQISESVTAQPPLIIVNSLSTAVANDGQCTLPEAMLNANDNNQSGSTDCAKGVSNSTETITFSVTGIIQLTDFLPKFNDNLNIVGPSNGVITIRGRGRGPGNTIFVVNTPLDSQPVRVVTLSNLDINNGFNFTFGGAISVGSRTVLNINNCIIADNAAVPQNSSFTAFGGAIANFGTLILNNSTIAGNTSPEGGGIWNGGDLYVFNSTITANSSERTAGIFNVLNKSVTIRNTIIAGNLGRDVGGNFISLGHNLIGNTTQGTGFQASDLLNVNARLAPLANYGGNTFTYALLPGSPAIDTGDNCVTEAAHCDFWAIPQMTADQRGFARMTNGRVDIGAFESRGFTISATGGTPQTTGITTPFSTPLVAGVSSSFDEPVTGGIVTFKAPVTGASGRFPGDVTTTTAGIDGNGNATAPTFTANSVLGSYEVGADIGPNSPFVAFNLTNVAADQMITLGTHAPSNAPYNSSFTVSATATSGLAVSYSSAGACTNNGAVFTMNASTGTCTVRYDQAGDNGYNAAPQATESVTAQKANQAIIFGTHAPAGAAYNSTFTVAATASSTLAVSYSSEGVCNIAGATLTMTASTGTCTVKYDQAGDGNYNAATQVVETVTAQKANQTITVGTHGPATAAYNSAFTVAATAVSGLAVSYSSGGACTNVGAVFTMTAGFGTCTLMYDQAGDGNYSAAPQVTESVTAEKANQTITVGTHALSSAVYNSTFTVAATANSGLPVTYSSSGACTNSGATFTMTSSSGTCTVNYDQAGDGNSNPAPQVTETVTAQKANQSITVNTHAPSGAAYNGIFTVAATASSSLAVSYSSSGACSNSGATFTMTRGTGTCTVTYDQVGDSNYNPAPQVTESVGAQRANQTITVGTHAPASAGYAGTFTVVAAASSGLPITYGSTGACSNFTATGVYTMTASAGTCTVTYDQLGDDNYNAGSQMSESVEARKGSQTITIDTHAPASAVYNTSFDVVGLASSGLIVTYSVTGDCTNFLFNIHMTAGTGSCTVKYDQAGNGNYDAAPQVTETVTAAKASQTITVDTHAPSTAAYNTSFMVSSHGSSIAPVIYSSSGACSNSGATFTMTSGTGTCTVTYDQVGDSNYNPAPQLTESVTAGKANQTITVSTHAPSSAAYNSSFTVAATSTSGVDVTYSSSGVCTNIGAAFTMISGPGPCTVKYDQAGDGNHNAAAQVTETVLRLNDAPSLDNSGSMGLSAINEDVPDATNPGTLVSGIIASAGGDRITDIDDGALEGIAVIAVDNANGAWQFSIDDGSKWTPFGSPDPLNARQLAANAVTKIRFVPLANFNGTVDPGLTFRAWDQTSGTNGNTGDSTIVGGTSAFSSNTETASITVNAVNDSPSISAAAPLTRQQGTAPSNSSVALVSDIDTPAGGLTVTATTVPAGITIANIVNTSGTITANIAAECGAATGNNSVVLQVSDGSLTATASLTVNVTANKLPVLTYGTASVINLGSTTINPATGPTDNGSIANVIVQSAGTYTGTISVNNSGVVSISNAGPVGSHTITVRATDNCGAAADAAFTLNVTNHTPSITAAAAVTRQRGSAGTISPIATVSDPDQSPGSLVVTATTVPSGITVTGITNTAGAVTANTAADCSAALGSNTVVLTVTDSTGGTATANFTVNVAANSAPTVTYAGPQGVAFGGTLNVTPTAAADNGSITGYSILNVVPALTTAPTVNSSGVVSVTNAQPGGAHTVTIRATDNCGVTTDTQFTLNVGTAATTTSVASSQNPSTFGQSVTFTATIATALGTPTGSVTFNIDGNPACINVPVTPPAACMLSTLATGNHSVTATYNGDSNFNASSGSILGGQTVSKTATSTAITNSLAAGTNSGQSYAVNWTVTVNPPGGGTPSGSVTVSDGTDNCSAAVAAGTCSLTSTTSGFKTITAVFSGDPNFNTSTSAGVAHTVMTAISGHIGQSGSTPEAAGLQGVMITLTGTSVPPGTTTTTDADGNYSLAVLPNGGNYTVTPSGAGVTFDPLSQNFTGLTTNVPNANFMAYTGSVPRELRIVNTYVMPGQAVIVPVMLNGLGNENTGQFSLNYDANHLSVPTVTCGSSDPGCLLELDTSLPGKLGIKITPATQLVAGVRNIANVTFQTFANEPSNTSITFGGSPTAELVSDAGANPLSATYSNALVIFGRGVEGDVAGRPDGSGSVNTSDITGIARFVAGTDTPGVQNTNEYQRADCAPAGTGGNGQLNASDIVQASRYSAGLDGGNQIAASGPFEQPNVSSQLIRSERADDESDQARQRRTMRVVSTMASAGGDVAVMVEMDSMGDEVASSFSLTFDPKKLSISDVSSPDTNADVSIGSDAPTGTGVTVNAANAERGQIGIVVFNSGLVPFSRGPVAKRVVTLTFHVAKDAPSGPTPVTFTAAEDGPTTRSLSDGNAKELKATYTDGEVNIIGSRAAGLSIPRRAVTTDQSNVNAATLGLIDKRELQKRPRPRSDDEAFYNSEKRGVKR